MEGKQSRNSLFVSLPGFFTLLFFAVTAIYFQASAIAAFLLFLALLCLASGLWSRGVLKRVEVEVSVGQGGCHAGDVLNLHLRVRNHSFFPLTWLDIIIPTGPEPIVRPKGASEDFRFSISGMSWEQTGVRARLVWLLWHQEISWDETLVTLRRGVVFLEGVRLQAGDGFGLSTRGKYRKLPAPLCLLIYPRLTPVRVQSFLKITQEAVFGSRGQTEDLTVLKNSRPYRPGDPMKRINWRLLALGRPMEINVYETVTPGCAAFLLDLKSFRKTVVHTNTSGSSWEETVLLERKLEGMISLIASCIRAVRERGVPTALIIPGYGNRDAVLCLPDAEDPLAMHSMEALARIDYLAQDTRFPAEDFWSVSHSLGNLYICARTRQSSSMADIAEQMGRGRAHYLVWDRAQKSSADADCLYAEDLLLEKPDLDVYKEQVDQQEQIRRRTA